MPAQKAKSTSSPDGAAPKGKAASTSGTATPSSAVEKKDTSDPLATFAGGKPDKKAYDAEQENLKVEIDSLQAKLNAVRDKISLATKSGPGNDRRNVLRAELESIREQQSGIKSSRGKILDQVKAIQDGIQKKINDLQAAKSKIPYKSVAEVDARIESLEKQVESGNMKLADEKRALQEISTSKRNRRIVEGFQADQETIEADRRQIAELKKQLDDPESKAISDRYEAIKAELDALKKEGDEAYAGRSKLFKERDDIQSQLKTLFNERRESSQRFRDANDRYWAKINEERTKRAERARAQRAAEEAQKKQETALRLREEAEVPAFQAQIEDCQTLINQFSGKAAITTDTTAPSARADVAGVPKLELRKVEDAAEGVVARKKKGDEEESYFISGKGKKGKKGTTKTNGTAEPPASPSPASGTLNVSLNTLSALLTLSIPPPVSNADVPRVIEDLKTKKAWFEANQARVTAENLAKIEADIQRLTGSAKDARIDEVLPPNGGGEHPAEPVPTPQAGAVPVALVSSEEVVDKLETVKEQEGLSEDS